MKGDKGALGTSGLCQAICKEACEDRQGGGKETRDHRVPDSAHVSFVRLRTSIKNRVHALLAIEGIQTSKFSDLFGKKGMEFLKGVKLREVSGSAGRED